MAFANLYSHRKVADTSSRSCDICYKATASVLITPDNKDFFYVCTQHLKDPNFCTPKIDQAAVEARRKKAMDEEVARVKREFEARQRKQMEEDGEKKDKGDKEKDGEKKEGEKPGAKSDDNKKGDEQEQSETRQSKPDDEPRLFELKSSFYQQRLSKKRQIELSRRNRERMQDSHFFPSVPRHMP